MARVADESDAEAVDEREFDAEGVHIVYVIECADGTLYTGYTTDLDRRIAEHNAGDGAKYTRGRTPVRLRYRERYDSKSEAMSREYEIKQLTRAEKERLIGLGRDRDG
ncbi:GIY-YIG nuclease family protein [Natrialbaceae archaeon GCM10025810]|uniref:GIY-YIG nuclease family protein n=1 Tax=Halovalidus salilacus TaxID=3075124 RepID=UPI003618FBCE